MNPKPPKNVVNPLGVVTINDDSFTLNTDMMIVGQTYIVEFQGERLNVVKTDDDAIIVSEMIHIFEVPLFVCVKVWRAIRHVLGLRNKDISNWDVDDTR